MVKLHRYIFPNNATSYTPRVFPEVHNVCKPRCHQTFIRVEIYPTNMMSKLTGNKTTEIKCNLDPGGSVVVLTLATYHLINPSEFNEQGEPIVCVVKIET